MNCPNCNAPIEKEYEFCGECGQKVNLGTTSKSTENSIPEDVTPTCRNCGAALGPGEQFCGQCGKQVEQAARLQENSVGATREADSVMFSKTLWANSSWSLLKVLVSRFFVVVIAYVCGLFGTFAISFMLIALGMEGSFIAVFICIITYAAIAASVALCINKLVLRLTGGWNIFDKSRSYLIVTGLGGAAYMYLCYYFQLEPEEVGFYIPIIVIAIVVTTLVQIIDLARKRKI